MLGVEDIEQRALRPHDVRIRMRAAGINPGGAKIRTGALHERFPDTLASGQGSDLRRHCGLRGEVSPSNWSAASART
ncbi:hypothetical protein [Streptomyces sp. NPDC059786]|uniref:hypothetical protein n=1 Tax=Streptomyces sp. NPDC059786 TaxID=3346946 RepID=UPI003669A2D8